MLVQDYIERHLGQWILDSSPVEYRNATVVECKVNFSDQLDGFLSQIYLCDVVVRSDGIDKTIRTVVKVMKGSEEFRTKSKAFDQCRNEVYNYGVVLPYFKEYLAKHNSSVDPDSFTPTVFYQVYGKIPELSSIDECIVVMENLSTSGFRNGPRLELDLDHFKIMMKTLGRYHGLQYAMCIENDPKWEELKVGLIPLPWKEQDGSSEPNLYTCFYTIAFERLFEYLDRHPDSYLDEDMRIDVGLLRDKFYDRPEDLLQLFGVDDPAFSVILHGDYNRNNILFKYDPENPSKPVDMRMIDFQEVRYASPAIDIFFPLYMNTSAEFRTQHWDDMLRLYHTTVWESLKEILKCDDSDTRLETYSYENFAKHYSRYALYGIMVPLYFLPWIDSSEEDCDHISREFTRDMTGEPFRQASLTAGGDATTAKIVKIVQHACQRGYMRFLRNV